MKRQIKIRVWDYTDHKWSSTIDIPHSEIVGMSMFFNHPNRHEYLQWTGLKDINDKDIYEGDVLESKVNEKPCNYVVVWHDDRSEYCGFGLQPVMKNPPKVTFFIHNFKIWMSECYKIIGNIYENPELYPK